MDKQFNFFLLVLNIVLDLFMCAKVYSQRIERRERGLSSKQIMIFIVVLFSLEHSFSQQYFVSIFHGDLLLCGIKKVEIWLDRNFLMANLSLIIRLRENYIFFVKNYFQLAGNLFISFSIDLQLTLFTQL